VDLIPGRLDFRVESLKNTLMACIYISGPASKVQSQPASTFPLAGRGVGGGVSLVEWSGAGETSTPALASAAQGPPSPPLRRCRSPEPLRNFGPTALSLKGSCGKGGKQRWRRTERSTGVGVWLRRSCRPPGALAAGPWVRAAGKAAAAPARAPVAGAGHPSPEGGSLAREGHVWGGKGIGERTPVVPCRPSPPGPAVSAGIKQGRCRHIRAVARSRSPVVSKGAPGGRRQDRPIPLTVHGGGRAVGGGGGRVAVAGPLGEWEWDHDQKNKDIIMH